MEYTTVVNEVKEILKKKKMDSEKVAFVEDALEKATPKTPETVEGNDIIKGENWVCPTCGSHYSSELEDFSYCPECGQKLS